GQRPSPRGAGFSLPGFGVSPNPFFFSRAASGGARKERRFSRGHPLYPAKGRLPLGTLLKLTPMRGPPLPGFGDTQTPFFSHAPPEAAREKERFSRGHPLPPCQGALAPWNPLKLTPMGASTYHRHKADHQIDFFPNSSG